MPQIMQRFGSDRDAMACLAHEMRVRLQSLAWRPDQLDRALDRGIYDRNARAQLRRVSSVSVRSMATFAGPNAIKSTTSAMAR